MENEKRIVAQNIVNCRKSAAITQAELAEKIGISAKQLSRIEMASFVPSLITFLKIVQILNLTLEDFEILTNKTSNPAKDKLIKIINSANDKELNLYNEMIDVLIKNLFQV